MGIWPKLLWVLITMPALAGAPLSEDLKGEGSEAPDNQASSTYARAPQGYKLSGQLALRAYFSSLLSIYSQSDPQKNELSEIRQQEFMLLAALSETTLESEFFFQELELFFQQIRKHPTPQDLQKAQRVAHGLVTLTLSDYPLPKANLKRLVYIFMDTFDSFVKYQGILQAKFPALKFTLPPATRVQKKEVTPAEELSLFMLYLSEIVLTASAKAENIHLWQERVTNTLERTPQGIARHFLARHWQEAQQFLGIGLRLPYELFAREIPRSPSDWKAWAIPRSFLEGPLARLSRLHWSRR